jgi:hypothetical protein
MRARGVRGSLLLIVAGLGFLVVASVQARIISYAPVSDRPAIPAVQDRTDRHFVLIEVDQLYGGVGPGGFAPPTPKADLVVYDAHGLEAPRVVLSESVITEAAAWEEGDDLRLLVVTDADLNADNPTRLMRLRYSGDGGISWKPVPLPGGASLTWLFTYWQNPTLFAADPGGPTVRGRHPWLRLGTAAFPFVLALPTDTSPQRSLVFAVVADGSARKLVSSPRADQSTMLRLVGSSIERDRFVVYGTPEGSPSAGLYELDLDGTIKQLLAAPTFVPMEAWLAGNSWVFLDLDSGATQVQPFPCSRCLLSASGGEAHAIAQPPQDWTNAQMVAVPAADFNGAWVAMRAPGHPTTLSSFFQEWGLTEAWHDPSGPEVEALHVARSGDALLVQVHRPRPQVTPAPVKDPALAIWHLGSAAPTVYDELFLAEQTYKGFVHLDVDEAAAGGAFVFNSGVQILASGGGGPSGFGGGGTDVVQEWGVVRASLWQRLVIPGVGRTAGYFGSVWRADVTLQNPNPNPLTVTLRFVPNGASGSAAALESEVSLAAGEIRTIEDALKTLFGLEQGAGCLYVIPPGGKAVSATGRVTNVSAQGSYGTAVPAFDVFAAAAPRFPLSFSGALQGWGFRSNLVAVNTGEADQHVFVRVQDGYYLFPDEEPSASSFVPAGGSVQVSGLAQAVGLFPWESGAATLEPTNGSAVGGLFVIDNTTNDAAFFGGDLATPHTTGMTRFIPAIVHDSDADGVTWRSDLFLANRSPSAVTVLLRAAPWDTSSFPVGVALTIFPDETRVIRDVLRTAFSMSGRARLEVAPQATYPWTDIRATSRTYAVAAGGGTFGAAIPPMNSFAAAGPGEIVEILGARGAPALRTDLAVLELEQFYDGRSHTVRVEILDGTGRSIDAFEFRMAAASGIEINDLFHTRGLGDGPAEALIRVSSVDGLVGAYATLTDRGTKDPSIFTGALAAR